MTTKQLLIGSLSNDLYRVANLLQRGSQKGALRFFEESKRWTTELQSHKVKPYIRKIIDDVINDTQDSIQAEPAAEKYLLYSILLQNYSKHI